tara:strand:+ start:772 stop:882 length:111 start_codon:yes stop_codon:yes gene_type:complete
MKKKKKKNYNVNKNNAFLMQFGFEYPAKTFQPKKRK